MCKHIVAAIFKSSIEGLKEIAKDTKKQQKDKKNEKKKNK